MKSNISYTPSALNRPTDPRYLHIGGAFAVPQHSPASVLKKYLFRFPALPRWNCR
jgi:hypothetical protein